MTLSAFLTLTGASRQPASASNTETAPAATTLLSTLFADFLNTNSIPADDASTLPELAQDNPQTVVLALTEKTDEQTVDTDTSEDAPWPPDGLASLWLPATATEPAPQLHSTAIPAPAAGAGSGARRVASTSLRVALTIQAPDTSTTASPPPAPTAPPPTTPEALSSLEHPARPISTPTIPASLEPTPPSGVPISENALPPPHSRNRVQENVSPPPRPNSP